MKPSKKISKRKKTNQQNTYLKKIWQIHNLFLINLIIYFQFDEPNYEGYGPDEYKTQEWHKYLNPKDVYSETNRLMGIINIVKALPIILVCSYCVKSKKYFRLNHSTFMIHFREYHQDKLNEAKVARCTICWTWFNSIATAKTHLERNHNNILTNRKQIREHQDIIEQTADKTQVIEYTNNKEASWLHAELFFFYKERVTRCLFVILLFYLLNRVHKHLQWYGQWWVHSNTYMIFFRWFKFTLKPPYTVAIGNFCSAIWDTSHWNFFVKFGLKTAWDISYGPFRSILTYVNFWWLQGNSSTWAKIRGLQKVNVFLMKEQWGVKVFWGVLGGQVPRLYGGTIFRGGMTPWGCLVGLRVQRFHFSKSLSNFFYPPNFGILTHKLAQMCNYMKSGIPFFFFIYFTGSVSELWPFEKFAIFGPTDKSWIYTMKGQQFWCNVIWEFCRGPFYLPKATFWEFVWLTVFS